MLYYKILRWLEVWMCFILIIIFKQKTAVSLLKMILGDLYKNKSSVLNFLVIATVALAFLLLPMCQYIIGPCSDGKKISFGMCGRFTAAELFSFSLSMFIVCIWVLTGNYISRYNGRTF